MCDEDKLMKHEIRPQPQTIAPSPDLGVTPQTRWPALSRMDIFGAFLEGTLAGVAGYFTHEGSKQAHKGVLWGMYVRPTARSSGLGRRLIEAVLDHARERVEAIQLTVVSENEGARRLYSTLGFVEYGLEKRALKQNGRYYDEVLMVRFLQNLN
jgi:ribosomal protein S18 acetylase RimI-like enzyme